MKQKMRLDEWMAKKWLEYVPGAEEYYMLQKLTEEQAFEILCMVAESTGFDILSEDSRQGHLNIEHPYRNFMSAYMCLLVEAGPTDINNWRKTLWSVLNDVDKKMLRSYAFQLSGCDIVKEGFVQ